MRILRFDKSKGRWKECDLKLYYKFLKEDWNAYVLKE